MLGFCVVVFGRAIEKAFEYPRKVRSSVLLTFLLALLCLPSRAILNKVPVLPAWYGMVWYSRQEHPMLTFFNGDFQLTLLDPP